NPGREEKYKPLTGKDQLVIEYLEHYQEVESFKRHVYALIDSSVDNYRKRKFDHFMVSFGCTGGQHRSVYFAECLAQHLVSRYDDIEVVLRHTNQ
ncbi:MAG: RNase adapter RapZ, partial [Bacteroidales bacterium]